MAFKKTDNSVYVLREVGDVVRVPKGWVFDGIEVTVLDGVEDIFIRLSKLPEPKPEVVFEAHVPKVFLEDDAEDCWDSTPF